MKSGDPMKRRFDNFDSEALYYEEGAILEFTENLVAAMQAAGLKRSDLAKRLNTSKSYITQILQGSTNFSLRTAARLAVAVGKQFRSTLETHEALTFYVSPCLETNKSAADGEAAVSNAQWHYWALETAASPSDGFASDMVLA